MTENALAGEIERCQRRLGFRAECCTFDRVLGRAHCASAWCRELRILQGVEPVMVDLSPVVGGYRADLTRTFHLGAPSAEFRRVYAVVRDALEHATEQLKPGMRASAVDAIARETIESAGFGAYFNHSLGHSFGLDQHEPPLLSPHDGTTLSPGMILTIEPGIYLPQEWGVRIEDAVIVTDSGCDVLTRSIDELRNGSTGRPIARQPAPADIVIRGGMVVRRTLTSPETS